MALPGLDRSLWLDEAWVANSVNAPSLGGMFYYPGWLQTSPPLFLVLVRAVIRHFGSTETALRVIPLFFGVLAAALMMYAAARVLSYPFACLATALVVFSPAVVEYSRTLKQYSGELAAALVVLIALETYLASPDRSRYLWLLLAITVTPLLAYPIAFLLPGVVVAVYAVSETPLPAIVAAAAAGMVFACEYVFFIRSNTSGALRHFWELSRAESFTPGVLAGVALVAWMGIRAWRERAWFWVACSMSVILLAISGALVWYPVSHRTRLFILPWFFLVLAGGAEQAFGWVRRKLPLPYMNAAVWAMVPAFAALNIPREIRNPPEEDARAAVNYVAAQAGAEQGWILLHPSVGETFRWYLAKTGEHPRVVYANTGWPCCQRSSASRPAGYENVAEDLNTLLPHHLHGPLWLVYTTRPAHWRYVGFDDRTAWSRYFAAKGCAQVASKLFRGIQAVELVCSGSESPERPAGVLTN